MEGGALLGSPGLSWALLAAPGGSWTQLGPPGVSWGILGPSRASWAPMPHFVDLERGPGNSNFLLQFAFKIALKPVLVVCGNREHSKFAFPLRIYSKLRLSSIWLALKICIPAADL